VARPPQPVLRALYFELGRALIEHGRHAEAVAALEQAQCEAGDAPRAAVIGRLLAVARAAVGDADGALDSSLKALLDAGPSDAEELMRQVGTLVPSARLAAHSELLSDARWPALLATPTLPTRARAEIGVLVGGALLQIDEPVAAERLLSRAARLESENPTALQLYGRVLERLGRHEDAAAALEAAYRQAVDKRDDRTATEIATERAKALLGAGSFELALASLPDQLPEDDQLRGRILQVRAEVLLASGSADEALTASTKAAKLVPRDLGVVRVQAQALVALHRGAEAQRLIDKGLNRNPTDEDLQLRRLLAQLEGQEGLDSADGWQQRFRRFDKKVIRACVAEPAWRGREEDGRAHYARATLFWALKDFPQAIAECRCAIELGLGAGLPKEPEAPVHALLAESLEAQGDLQAATEAHFDAGAAYYYRSDWAEAVRHLEPVATQHSQNLRAFWILADALRSQAVTMTAASTSDATQDDAQSLSAEQAAMLERAAQVWDQGADAFPDKVDAWAYGFRALINEARIPHLPERRADLLWAGTAFIERGVLKDDQNSFLWTTLGRMCRMLKLNACARAAMEKALEIAPNDLNVLEERIISCINSGDYDGALPVLETFEAQVETLEDAQQPLYNSWQLACRATVSAGLGADEEALRLVQQSRQDNDGQENDGRPWVHSLVGRIYRLLGDREASRRAFTEILAHPEPTETDWEQLVAEAHFGLGRPDEALAAYERWRLATGIGAEDIELSVGLCQLLRGDVEEGRRTIEARVSRDVNREDISQLRYCLRVITDEADGIELRKRLGKIGKDLVALAEHRVQELAERPTDPDAELLSAMDKPSTSREVCTAAIAGLARRACEREAWEEAAVWYERLEEMRDLFPELNSAFERVATGLEDRSRELIGEGAVPASVQTLEAAVAAGRHAGRTPSALASMHQTLGDALVRRGDAEPARAQYASALGLVDDEELATVTALRARVAIASDLDGIADPRRERLATVLRSYPATSDTEQGRALGELARSLIGSAEAYLRLDSAWAHASDDPALPADLRPAVANALAALVGALDDVLGLTRIPDDLWPVVTPIVFELGDALVPIVDSQQDGGHFLYELIPRIRERVSAATGVTMPGVRARGSLSLGPNEFSIMLDEVPVITAALDPSARFAVHPGARPDSLVSDFHPLTGKPGLWAILPVEAAGNHEAEEELTAADLLAHHIERAVRANLRNYLGPYEVSQLVEAWCEDQEELIAAVLPGEEAQLRLTWLLQALADDGVPLTDSAALLSGIRDAGGIDTPTRTLRNELRLRFRDRLPGPSTGLMAVPLPAEHEAGLGDNGTVVGRFEFQRWLREYIKKADPGIMLVTMSPQVRELVSELARAEHPMVRTLTQEELNGPSAVPGSAANSPGSA
jgi:tetratricopeptide (TPR) repeat protein